MPAELPQVSAVPRRRVSASLVAAAIAGMAVGTGLVLYFGLDQVGNALASAGWRGLAAMSAAYLASVVICAFAWRAVIVPPLRRAMLVCHWARLLRDSVGNILAVIPAAGEAVAARELTNSGLAPAAAAASTIVDLTMEIVSQLLFTLLGLTILVIVRPELPMTPWAFAGLLVSAIAIAGFVIAQRKGLFRLLQDLPERLHLGEAFSAQAKSFDIHDGIEAIYRQPWRIATSCSLHLLAWIVGAAEAWLALYFMGHGLGFGDVLVIESLVFALRTMAFVVPWAAGVQEGTYIAVGAVFGLSPDVALGVSLLKRARELATGIPCLLAWQTLEGRRLWKTSRQA